MPRGSDPVVTGGRGSDPVVTPEPLLNYGAPNMVRLAVETARPRDKLATLQRFYPDAEPTPDGNFLYTDESGGKTLFNASGLDVGDVAGLTRPAIETLGAGLGAAAATPAGIPGMLAGGVLGGVAGGQTTDIIMKALGMPSAAGPVEQAKDLSTDALTNLTSEVGGMAVQAALPRIGRVFANPEAVPVADATARLGIRPTTGMVGATPVSGLENMIARVLPGSKAAREQNRIFNDVAGAARDTVPGVAGSVTPREAGETLKQGVDQAYDRYRRVREIADQRFLDQMPANATVPVAELALARGRLGREMAALPNTGERVFGPIRDQIDEALADAARYGGNVPLAQARRLRRRFGELLNVEATTSLTPEAQRVARDAYHALRGDLRSAARTQSPQALRAFDRHDRLVSSFRSEDLGREGIADSFDKILKANSDEAAYSALFAKTGGANRLQQVTRYLRDPERRVVARAAWDQMMTTPAGNFNLNRLVGQWAKTDPVARRELFGRVADVDAIDDLMTVIGGMREADRSRNFSNTAYTMMQAEFGDKLVGEIAAKVGAISGSAGAAGGAIGAGMIPVETLMLPVSAYLMSEAVHTPGMARAIANAARGQPVRMTETVRRGLGRVLARTLGDEEDEDEKSKAQGSPPPIPMLPTP